MSTTRKSISDADALLLYQVGPVYCCSPTLPVESVIMPPRLTHPPGTTSSMPGFFKFSSGIVHVVDLRKRFGVDEEDKREPGRIVVVEVEGGHAGIWVDEIIDVIQFPSKGWGPLPAHIPRKVFSKTLLYDKKIMLYADFDDLHKIREAGYLRQHIEVLKKEAAQKQVVDSSAHVKPIVKNISGKKSLAEELPLKEHVNHASTAITDVKQSSTIQSKQPGLDQSNEATITHDYNAPIIPTNQKSTESGALSHSIAKTRLPETGQVESLASKPGVQHQVKINSKYVADSNKHKAPVKIYSENKRVIHSSPIRQIDFAENDRIKNNSGLPTSVIMDRTYQENAGKSIEASSESNMAIWFLGVVIIAMLLVMYYSFDNLFPEKAKKSPEIVVSWPDPATETQGFDIQTNVEDVSISEVISNAEPTVITEPSRADLEKTALNDYRANIAHNKDDIVIVLQQPESEGDVFNKDATESNIETLSQQDEIPSQIKSEIETVAILDVDEIAEQREANKPEPVIPAEEVVEKNGNLQVVPDAYVADKEISSSDKMQVTLPVTQAVEVHKKVSKKQVTHVVVKGDTLWHIAKRYIKNPYRYPELARLSKIKNPDLIYPGNKVIIIIETKKTRQSN